MSEEHKDERRRYYREWLDVRQVAIEELLDNSDDQHDMEKELQKGKHFAGSSIWTT